MSRRELTAVAADGVGLAGSLWAPDARAPRALIAMHPGFGPADRDAGGLFPPIRAALLEEGVAVCSFDKRGVGESGGSWLQADIDTQTADLTAAVAAAQAVLPGLATGLFGHSQGGWAALAAAGPASADFVICNSTPGVTPRAQEAFTTRAHLAGLGLELEREIEASATFDELMWMLSGGTTFEEANEWMSDPSRHRALADLADADAALPADEALWDFVVTIVDYDAAESLRSIRVPLLALFGGSDDIVPVEESADRYAELVPPHLLTLHVLAGGDHGLRIPGTEAFAPGYLDALTDFVGDRL
ncbi:alpha/beta hydrolase [Leifsonia sp. NPDC058248]|uniref:alpha/beta hydrolase n=1 Tax=Leifsonia sp. NPDC058248 TaxID=3346402 RepID=UPI0036DDFFE2